MSIKKIIDIQVKGTDKLAQLERSLNESKKQLQNLEKAGKKNAGMQKIQSGKVA